jgi:SNF2 family DNA or RNA helicase
MDVIHGPLFGEWEFEFYSNKGAVNVPDTSNISAEESRKEEVFAAIQDLEGALQENSTKREALKVQSDIQRAELEYIKHILSITRQRSDAMDREVRKNGDQEKVLKDRLEWLRGVYADILTRDKKSDELWEEFEFYDRIAANSVWGKRAFPHQIEGAKQMAHEKRGIIADTMGLGKTLTSIILMAFLESKRNLIVAPNDVVSNFAREVGKWEPERNMIALGTIKDKKTRHQALKLLARMEEFTVLINYEVWRRDPEIRKLLIALKFETVIIDEAHNLKDPKSKNFTGLKEIIYAENDDWSCPHCKGKMKTWPFSGICTHCGAAMGRAPWNGRCSVKNVFPMTGTAILNAPGDIWPMLNLIDNAAFYDQTQYLKRYCKQVETYSLVDTTVKKWVFGPGGADMLTRKLGPKYLRRTLDTPGIPKLPPQDIQYHTISFDDEEFEGKYEEQRKVIRWINNYNAIMLNEAEVLTIPHILAILTRTRQAITWPAGIILRDPETKQPVAKCEVEESIKVDYAEKLLTEFVQDAEQRCILFSQFKAPLAELKRRLEAKGIRCGIYDGDTPQAMKDHIAIQMDAGFTDKKNCEYDVILANYRSGGVGFNFTNATQTVVLDREWNPGKEDQAFGRTNRFGQTEGTTVHIIEVEGTIDDGIREIIKFKSDIINGLDVSAKANAEERVSLIEYLKRRFNES